MQSTGIVKMIFKQYVRDFLTATASPLSYSSCPWIHVHSPGASSHHSTCYPTHPPSLQTSEPLSLLLPAQCRYSPLSYLDTFLILSVSHHIPFPSVDVSHHYSFVVFSLISHSLPGSASSFSLHMLSFPVFLVYLSFPFPFFFPPFIPFLLFHLLLISQQGPFS